MAKKKQVDIFGGLVPDTPPNKTEEEKIRERADEITRKRLEDEKVNLTPEQQREKENIASATAPVNTATETSDSVKPVQYFRHHSGQLYTKGQASGPTPKWMKEEGAKDSYLVHEHGRTNHEIDNNISREEAHKRTGEHQKNKKKIAEGNLPPHVYTPAPVESGLTGIARVADKVVANKEPETVETPTPPTSTPKPIKGEKIARKAYTSVGDTSSIIDKAREKASKIKKPLETPISPVEQEPIVKKEPETVETPTLPTPVKPEERPKRPYVRKKSFTLEDTAKFMTSTDYNQNHPDFQRHIKNYNDNKQAVLKAMESLKKVKPTKEVPSKASFLSKKSSDYAKNILDKSRRSKKPERVIATRRGGRSLQSMKDYRAELEKNKEITTQEPTFSLSPTRQTSGEHRAEQRSHVEALKNLVKRTKRTITPEDTAEAMSREDFGPDHPDYATHVKNFREHTAEVHAAREKLKGGTEQKAEPSPTPKDGTKPTQEPKKTSKIKKFSDFVKEGGKKVLSKTKEFGSKISGAMGRAKTKIQNKALGDIQKTKDFYDFHKTKEFGSKISGAMGRAKTKIENKALGDMQKTKDFYDFHKPTVKEIPYHIKKRTERDIPKFKEVAKATGRGIAKGLKSVGKAIVNLPGTNALDNWSHDPKVNPTPRQTAQWIHSHGENIKNLKSINDWPKEHHKNITDKFRAEDVKRHLQNLRESVEFLDEARSKKDDAWINLSGKKIKEVESIPGNPEYERPPTETEKNKISHNVSAVISHPDKDNGKKMYHSVKIRTTESDPKKVENMARRYHEGRGYTVHSVKHDGEDKPNTSATRTHSYRSTPIQQQRETIARNERKLNPIKKQSEEPPPNFGGHIIHSGGVSDPIYVHALTSEDAKEKIHEIGKSLEDIKGIKGVIVHDQKSERPYTVHTGHYDDDGNLIKTKHTIYSEYSSNPKIQKGTERNIASMAELIHAHKHGVKPHHEFTQTEVIPHRTK